MTASQIEFTDYNETVSVLITTGCFPKPPRYLDTGNLYTGETASLYQDGPQV